MFVYSVHVDCGTKVFYGGTEHMLGWDSTLHHGLVLNHPLVVAQPQYIFVDCNALWDQNNINVRATLYSDNNSHVRINSYLLISHYSVVSDFCFWSDDFVL